MQVIDKTREETEERLLLEILSLLLVQTRQHKDKDRQDFRQVVNFCLVVIDSRSVTVVLDDVHNEP